MTATAPHAMPDRLDPRSQDVAAERVARLREDFPEVFREGRIDFDHLKRSLGEWVDPGKERFGLTWPGKAECMRTIQQPSVGTLEPDRGKSVAFDETENVVIEGENLEVLKLLQKGYHGAVKLIYIDPPYNTGGEFIYPDNFREGLQDYLRYSGQVDGDGLKLSTNTEAGGRYHSKWLNMMYPRLYLARNLLREDGAIFVSIDDNEAHNLRALMNEIFGEENFIATIIWQKVFAPKNSAQFLSEDHDYVVVYARDAERWKPGLLPRTAEADARYENPDNDPRGPWQSDNLTARNYYSKGQYEVTGPTGKTFRPAVGRYWTRPLETFLEMDRNGEIWWGANGDGMPRQKRFLKDVAQGMTPQTLWKYADVGHTQEAKKELLEHVAFGDTENVLNSVKPSRLLQRIVQIGTSPDGGDLVLDFFMGSGSAGHAVLRQNAEDGGNRRFLGVQLPEPLPKPEPGLRTIFDIARQRLLSVGRALAADRAGKLDLDGKLPPDLGFRAYRLTDSNFTPWEGDPALFAPGAHQAGLFGPVARQVELFADNLRDGRDPEAILTEILLKAGFPLTVPVARLTLAGQEVFSVADGVLLVCLERPIRLETIEAMAERDPAQIVVLDAGFGGNDQLKVNAVQTVRARARATGGSIAFQVA